MAATSSPSFPQPPQVSVTDPTNNVITSTKKLAESPGLTSLPSHYTFPENSHNEACPADPEDSIPTIDFSLLSSADPHQRSKIIRELGSACEEWGFFMVINHGVPESMVKGVIDVCRCFFELADEEKQEFRANNVWDPIRYGTSFNVSVDEILYWRDYLKIIVHPEFHSLTKPVGFSDIILEYTKRVRGVARELLKGISASLGLEENYIEKTMDLENGLQIVVANLYPPCPQPELAMGLPSHSDQGLLTILVQNKTGGLQVKHKGKWVIVDPIPNSFVVNVADHIEILSNGKYKSVLHRAAVNNKATRVSVAVAHGPALESIVVPAPELVDGQTNPQLYRGMKYKDYLERQQSTKLEEKSMLEYSKITVG